MNSFKLSFKIKEFELNIEGEKEDIALLTDGISQQLNGIILPAASFANDGKNGTKVALLETNANPAITRPRKYKKRTTSFVVKTDEGTPIEFKNDPAKYGSPIQDWSTLQKSMWLMYVLTSESNLTELSAGELTVTFNKHYKQQGKIHAPNVSRDLGKQKSGSKALVGENANENPSKWYLTAEGIKSVQALVEG